MMSLIKTHLNTRMSSCFYLYDSNFGAKEASVPDVPSGLTFSLFSSVTSKKLGQEMF